MKLLAQGRYWKAAVRKGSEALTLSLLREGLPADIQELRDLRIEVPLARWNGVLKHVRSDRKLLGGMLLDFARDPDRLAAMLSDERLYGELRGIVLDASAGLVEEGLLSLATPQPAPSAEEG